MWDCFGPGFDGRPTAIELGNIFPIHSQRLNVPVKKLADELRHGHTSCGGTAFK
jgi:hypothetical protein